MVHGTEVLHSTGNPQKTDYCNAGVITTEMNEAVLRQYHISYLVTMESGVSGGYLEKLTAAQQMGVWVFAIGYLSKRKDIHLRKSAGSLKKFVVRKLFLRRSESKKYKEKRNKSSWHVI